MKFLACSLFAFLALSASPLLAAPDRYEKQEAASWVKEEMGRLKKTQALLKRVKDEKSAEKAGKALLALYKVERQQTALGEVGPASKPSGEAMEQQEERNAARLEKMLKAIEAQRERIDSLELDSPTLTEAYAEMDAALIRVAPAAPSADEP